MLHILFLILKIIAIILLIILGLVLLLTTVVLLVPIRYRAKIETTEGVKNLRVEVRATWCLRILSAHVIYQKGVWDWRARIAWKKLKDRVQKQEKAHVKTGKNVTTVDKKRTETETPQQCNTKTKPETKREPEKEDYVKKQTWIQKLKCTIRKICDNIKKIKDYITEETNIKAAIRVRKEILYYLKKIRPRKVKGLIRFGMEDPYDTGRILAVLSMLYPFYGECFEIYPEFDRKIIEVDVFAKGRMHMLHLLLVICRLYFDENVKSVLSNIKSKKEQK